MPRKSVYFPDEQWPRIERAAELEDRSVSKWLQRAADRAIEAQRVPDARTVHATTEDGRQIVRYDRAGRWYAEGYIDRKAITLAEAVRLACLAGSTRHTGMPGGTRFNAECDRRMAVR